MRPDILFPLFAPVGSLPGVGPRLSKLFQSLAGEKVLDLCWHLPSGIVDRRYSPTLGSAIPGRVATLIVLVGSHQPPRNKRQPYRIGYHDEIWQHTFGCRGWLRIERHNYTHDVRAVTKCRDV